MRSCNRRARVVQALVRDFGEFALAEFTAALETVTPQQRQRIRRLRKEQSARQRRAEGAAYEC